MAEQRKSTVDAEEIDRFEEWAESWWDESGAFAPLHKFNPVRLRYIRDVLCSHFGREAHEDEPLKGLSLIDIGCGGGLVCEPMARLGAAVTGIDASAKNVGIASVHAEQSGLEIDYRHTTAEALASDGAEFDAVLSLEVIEHVPDPAHFIDRCAALAAPGGALICATLNRTARSLALAKIGAEYILRWLPVGTHDWRKFVRPGELTQMIDHAGLTVRDTTGVVYNPLRDQWSLSRDTGVNYMIYAARPR